MSKNEEKITCTKCGESKPLRVFSNNAKGKKGKSLWCKACLNKYQKANNESKWERDVIKHLTRYD